MFNRINHKEFQGIIEGEKLYLDKFVILDKEKYFFRRFDEIISFLEIPLSIVDKVKVPEEIKSYFVKILSAISSTKPLHIENFGIDDPNYDKEDYKGRVGNVINNLYTPLSLETELFSIFETATMTMDEYKVYSKEESFQERMERVKRGEKKPAPEKISIVTDDRHIAVSFPEGFKDKYNQYICIIVKVVTGDFYTDLFLELLETCSTVTLSKNCPVFEQPYITEEQVHVEVGIAVDNLLQAMIYLKNSSSFRSGELYVFDEIEIDRKMEWAKNLLERATILH